MRDGLKKEVTVAAIQEDQFLIVDNFSKIYLPRFPGLPSMYSVVPGHVPTRVPAAFLWKEILTIKHYHQ